MITDSLYPCLTPDALTCIGVCSARDAVFTIVPIDNAGQTYIYKVENSRQEMWLAVPCSESPTLHSSMQLFSIGHTVIEPSVMRQLPRVPYSEYPELHYPESGLIQNLALVRTPRGQMEVK